MRTAILVATLVLAAGAAASMAAAKPPALPGDSASANADALKPAAPAAPPTVPPPAPPEAKPVLTQFHALYLSRQKIGYISQSLYEFPDRGRRLKTDIFLRKDLGSDRLGYTKQITADVDARFRPRALDCSVISGLRQWQVKGRVDGNEFVMERRVGDKSATARIPLDEDLTFRSWALEATLLGGHVRQGEAKRWIVIDESLGAVGPDPVIVQYLGQRASTSEGNGPTVSGHGLVSVCGPEQVAHLVGLDGRLMRSIWQSTPMVAEFTNLAEARRLKDAAEGPTNPMLEGFEAERYRDARNGFSIWIPPYPFVAHAAPGSGAVMVSDMTDEAYVLLRLFAAPRPASTTGPDVAELARSELQRGSDIVQREWAARFQDVTADPPADDHVGIYEARAIPGSARLGCTTVHFRNYFVAHEGRTCLISMVVADRPVREEPILEGNVVQSVRLAAPEGMLPLQASGNTIRSVPYGFELRRPNARWIAPAHLEGPANVLELVRDDQTAVALIRIATPKPGQALETFVREQAQLASENLEVRRPPEPKATALAGREAFEISYEAPKALSGRPAQCTNVYTKQGGRFLSLLLMGASGADPGVARELTEIRESLKLATPPEPK